MEKVPYHYLNTSLNLVATHNYCSNTDYYYSGKTVHPFHGVRDNAFENPIIFYFLYEREHILIKHIAYINGFMIFSWEE